MYDVIIIGAGPAGFSASIYTIRKKLSTLILYENIGGQATKSFKVENYLGFKSITGVKLIQKFKEHVDHFNIPIKQVTVEKIKQINKGFQVITLDNKFACKAIIIASGKTPRTLCIPGEKKFLGKGVSFCATCDAPLFKNKTVAIIGGGNAALDTALQLSKIAKKVYLININPEFVGDEVTEEKVKKSSMVEILTSTEILEIKGKNQVKKIKIKNKIGKQKELNIDGVFVEIGSIPASFFVKNLVKLNKKGEIKIDSQNKTNIPGIFAAGDVTNVAGKQIIIAAGEGAKAALSTYEYVTKNR
jgi:thioredoxin-disulfide reductase